MFHPIHITSYLYIHITSCNAIVFEKSNLELWLLSHLLVDLFKIVNQICEDVDSLIFYLILFTLSCHYLFCLLP